MSHDRGCFRCFEDRGEWKYCALSDCPHKPARTPGQIHRLKEGKKPVKDLILAHHLARQADFSARTFGLGIRTEGIIDHILSELDEIKETNGLDLMEWIDVIILACDGALRAGFRPQEISDALDTKQTINENRKWPDWKTAEPGKAIEHIEE